MIEFFKAGDIGHVLEFKTIHCIVQLNIGRVSSQRCIDLRKLNEFEKCT